jgi:hypothetical protein
MRYPDTIDGCYEIDFDELTLTPIDLPNVKSNDFQVKEIWFEDGLAKIIFDNGYVQLLPTWYDKSENEYSIVYDGVTHCFQVTASLAGINKVTDMKLLITYQEYVRRSQ